MIRIFHCSSLQESPNARVVNASRIETILACLIFLHCLTMFMACSLTNLNPKCPKMRIRLWVYAAYYSCTFNANHGIVFAIGATNCLVDPRRMAQHFTRVVFHAIE